MATLSDKHFGNPGRSLYQAHYNIVHKKSCLELFPAFYLVFTCKTMVMGLSAYLGGLMPRRLVAAH